MAFPLVSRPTGCLAVIVLAAQAALYLRPSRASEIDSIAVAPFANAAGDAQTDYLF
jgi:TolB-like protein